MTSRSIIFLTLVFVALIFTVSVGLRFAEGAGMIGAEEARRTMQVLIGLGFAAYANIMPKQLWRMGGSSPRAEAWAQTGLRVGGWSLMLAGLTYAGLWGLAPLTVAAVASKVVLAIGAAITIGFALWSYFACHKHARRDHLN